MEIWQPLWSGLYSSPPGQNGHHFKGILLNENDRIQIRISLKFVPSIGSGNGLGPNKRQAITWTNADPVHWGIYVALGGDELMCNMTINDTSSMGGGHLIHTPPLPAQ